MLEVRRAARLGAVLVSTLLAAALVTACGSDDSDEPTGSGASEAAGGAFPVTIAHKFGQTTIKAEPKRIVTVGLTDQDAVLALGKVPVGTTLWYGDFPGAIGPWAQAKLGGQQVPTVLKDTGTGPQVEKIAALRPDLILALYGGLTDKQYQQLSKFAPVVAQPGQYADYGIPWQEQTVTIGKALGKQAEATKLVGDLERRFSQIQRENPEFVGKTAVTATPYEGFFVYGPDDPRSRMLSRLGFKLPADLGKVVGKEFGVNISNERTDLLDQDVIVWSVPEVTKESAKLHANKLYGDLNVVKEGREVFVGEDTPYGYAYSFQTILALPYVLDRLVPQLKAALDGNTSTKVNPAT